MAGVFAFFLLAHGRHPADLGFTGKWAALGPLVAGGHWPLVVVACYSARSGVLLPRVIVLMFFSKPVGEGP